MDQRASGFALLTQERVPAEMWNTGFTYGVGGTRLGVNLPRIHLVEIIAAVADANAAPTIVIFPVVP